MTRLTDAQYLELAIQCLEHARQSTAIRDCQCHACKGFMQQSGELIEDIKKRSAQETFASPPPTEDERPADPDCVKCAGKGWLWGRELDDADPPTMEDTMTQYSCDSTGCRDARLAANGHPAPCCGINASYPGKHRGGCPGETRSEPPLGFGILILRDMVLECMRGGLSKDDAITAVARNAELRSEAIEALRSALNR